MTRKLSRLTEVLLQQHRAIILILHVCLISASLLISWLLRFEFVMRNGAILVGALPILIFLRLTAMARFNLLHGNWRFTGVDDAADIVKATAVGSIAFFAVIRLVLHIATFPISVYIIEAVLTGCMLATVRLSFRVLAEASGHVSANCPRKQVALIGAGFAAQMIIRELRARSKSYWVVGCLDDDPRKKGSKVLGKPVLGTVDDLPEVAARHGVEEVLIAVPSATSSQMRRFVDVCDAADLKYATVPSLNDLISGKAQINDIRNVDLEDLLGRQPIRLDIDFVRRAITGKVVLVTGAAGSIGSELCRQILHYEPSKLICLDHSETGLFYLQMELGSARAIYCVADYTHGERMSRLFAMHSVHTVFHAGAYKHVPLMEANLREALDNNVFGLKNFLEIAEAAHCQAFVLISSDKAVNPTSFMGCTKRLGELMLSSRPASGMRCVSVRFGNVLGSQGSVVPVFQKQLAEDRRLTVTHPEMTRYFMTIREAVSLVLQAAAIGNHRDILVLDMGEPVRIVDLARTLIRLSGRNEHEVEIVFTGLRPGEKLYEELFYEDEGMFATQCPHINRTQGIRSSWVDLKNELDQLHQTMFHVSDAEIRRQVQRIIPQYAIHPEQSETPVQSHTWRDPRPTFGLAAAASQD
jgi:FlaA1/EpsC-like NDP-sugar epimerase